jgi:RHS repeat-associated protein
LIWSDWQLLAEMNVNISTGAQTLLRSYSWGPDQSGRLNGAGGVGGLIAIRDAATGDVHLPSYDGNGNVLALTRASDNEETARYEYGPFGEVRRISGTIGPSNPFRWSTKWNEEETGLSYYGYRHYHSGIANWLSRDPIGEKGGPALYRFVRNIPTAFIDPFGLQGASCACECAGSIGDGTLGGVTKGQISKGNVRVAGRIQVQITLEYNHLPSGNAAGNEATLKWTEKSNILPPKFANQTPNVEYDAHALAPNDDGFKPWRIRSFVNPKVTNFTDTYAKIFIEDDPSQDSADIAVDPERTRRLKIRVELISAANCKCTHRRVWKDFLDIVTIPAVEGQEIKHTLISTGSGQE